MCNAKREIDRGIELHFRAAVPRHARIAAAMPARLLCPGRMRGTQADADDCSQHMNKQQEQGNPMLLAQYTASRIMERMHPRLSIMLQ